MRKIDDVNPIAIKVAGLIALLLLGLVGLINFGFIGQTVTIIVTFVFGFVGYWFIFPFMIFISIFFIIKRHKKINPLKNVYFIAGALIFFGVLLLSSVLAYYPASTDKTLSATTFTKHFYESWLSSTYANSFNNYLRFNPLSTCIGGGFFGHLFAGLLNSAITPIGTIIASSLIIVIGLVVALFSPIKIGMKTMSHKHEEKKQKIEEKRLNEEAIIVAQRKDIEVTSQATLENDEYYEEETKYDSDFKRADLYGEDAAPAFEDDGFVDTVNKADISKEDIPVIDKTNEPVINNRPYILPSLDLLVDHDNASTSDKNEAQAKANTEIINRSFERLHIGAKAISYTIGPRVTRFDIQIDENASIQAIPKYVKDIGQRLGGVRPRFEEIVTGKMTSGLEIPNASSSVISFKEIVSALPSGDKNILLIPFGKDIAGDIKYANLAKFPHMLVAGSTGSGKSVFIHSIIMSLIMRNTPDDLRLLLVDPKQVEFTKYKNSPFLLSPTITDPSKAKVALEKLCEEMDRRYKLFADASTNQITSYNEIMKMDGKKGLPYIVVIVDEFADLIQQNKKIDGDINRIAQKARAAGIHLIIATQRPSVDVITGTIKANLPVRVALFVSDQESSKTILGCQGAEGLLGNGDMLVSCPQVQTQGNFRCQSPFVEDKEIIMVNRFINEQREPSYDPRFLNLDDVEVNDIPIEQQPKLSMMELKAQSDDSLYELIKEAIYKREYTSISSLQREFEIGFNRAGRMFKRLLTDRLVSPINEPSKGNKVLKENFNFPKSEQIIGSAELSSTKPNGEDL